MALFAKNLKNTKIYARQLFLAFMLTTLIVPVTVINKILFLTLLTWTILLLAGGRFPRKLLVLPSIGIIGVFLYGYGLAMLNPNDQSLAIQFLLASFIPLLIHFVLFYELDLDRDVDICGRIMVVVTAANLLLFLNPDIPNATEIVWWYREISQSTSAKRDYLGDDVVLTLALSSAPFLYLPWCLALMRLFRRFRWSDLMWLILYGMTIILSGARGIILVSLIFMVYIALTKSSLIIRLLFLVMMSSILFTLLSNFLASTIVFSPDESSNAVKIGHLQSFWDQLTWSKGIFGSGLGSYYFSSGSGVLKQHTELTPIDLTRYVGFPLAIATYVQLLLPRTYNPLRGQRHLLFVTFALYLLLSVTNPVLINSVGMLVVIWYWSKYLMPSKDHALQKMQRLEIINENLSINRF
jgi:hypothetical protein